MTEPYKEALAKEARQVRRLGWILSLLTAMLLVVLALYLWPLVRAKFGDSNGQREITARGDLADWEKTNIAVAKKATPSVVYITTESQVVNRLFARGRSVSRGSGSGFIWDEQGRIVTNYHVIQNADVAHVILSDQTSYDAEVIGMSIDHDLAVLKINVPLGVRLIPIPIGTSEDLQVGQGTFAIGNPFGLEQTVTTGIVSAVGRSIMNDNVPIEDVVQTDAAINPGNSGGPLLDSAGRLIGVNTAIISPNGQWAGIGFAIPVDTARRVIPQIITTGKYERSWIGVIPAPERQQGMAMPQSPVAGVAVQAVDPGSPAEKAGITGMSMTFGRRGSRGTISIGDVITQINERSIRTVTDLYSVMDRTKPGTKVTLHLWNAGAIRQVEIVTQPTPAQTAPATPMGGAGGGRS